jgi:hypothetical protein
VNDPQKYVTVCYPLVGGGDMTLRLPYPMTEEAWAHFMQYIEILRLPMLWTGGNPASAPERTAGSNERQGVETTRT